jgi:hypothetical protein
VKFSMRARLACEVMVIEAFENPLRFRFDLVGEELTRRCGASLAGKFTDEVDLHPPIERLTEQCRATVERRAPTFFLLILKKLATTPSMSPRRQASAISATPMAEAGLNVTLMSLLRTL